MNARRYPRTMEAAFGPYHRSSVCPVEAMPDPHRTADLAVYIACAIGAVAVACALYFN